MADIEQLLVPMDGSPLSERALRIALSEYQQATVTVLHVIDPTKPGYSYPVETDPYNEPLHGSEEWYERSRELAEQLFEDVHDVAAEYEADVTTETAVGEPGRAIVDYVDHHDVDQIVIGSHGRDEDTSSMLGSVTETVVFRSPVRVLLVR
ncbi:universal stress protein [Haloarculaceae archaeon H-GB2-1]|nr:universal stress protein [Haloarculaceae archaeon H-GB1-1]MEA5387369.1 universal stress protein [Haloarculaceae archaeon H-GB11]MEA5408840.1 universal stress protein [Haloarculaceae archaeon H-GB2-1]